MSAEEKGMNKKQFAERIGVSVPTVDRMIKAGKIKPVRIGARVLFRDHHVRRILDSHDTSKNSILSEANVS